MMCDRRGQRIWRNRNVTDDVSAMFKSQTAIDLFMETIDGYENAKCGKCRFSPLERISA